jgi:SnoaL-like domain
MSLNGLESEVKLNFQEEGRSMVTHVDEAYWQDYFRTHNEGRFRMFVPGFYAENATFEDPVIIRRGHTEILNMLETLARDAQIRLQPKTIIVKPGWSAVELDSHVHALKDIPNFLMGSLKKGEEATMPMAAVYHMAGDLIARARIYWGRCP